jgi:hypothetical protein
MATAKQTKSKPKAQTTTTKPKAQPKAIKPEADQIDWLTEGKTVEEEKLPVVAAQPSFMIAQRDDEKGWPVEALVEARSYITDYSERGLLGHLDWNGYVSQNDDILIELARELRSFSSLEKNRELPTWMNKFVEVIGKGCETLASAAVAAGATAGVPGRWLTRYHFHRIYDAMIFTSEKATLHILEKTLFERATDKNDKFSSTLLIFALKKLNPAYRDSIAVQNQTNLNMVSTGDNSSWAIIPSNPDQPQK